MSNNKKLTQQEILEILDKYEARSMHGQIPVVWDKAKDSIIQDETGKKYIDFTSGIFVTNMGHSVINKALVEQIKTQLIYSYTFPTEIRARFIKKLIDLTPNFCDKVFLMSSGTEATECAVKLMKLHGKTKGENVRFIISFRGCMHGRTFLAERLSDGGMNNLICLPFPVENSDWYANLEYIEGFYPVADIAGIIIESYQGWSARFMPKNYIQNFVSWAKHHKIPVCFDEIQGGFYRTGKMFAYEHYEVEPDLLCLGKGLGGGIPISAVIGKKELLDLPPIGSMSSTFSANPLCCAGALKNLELLENFMLPANQNIFKEASSLFCRLLRNLEREYQSVISDVNVNGFLAGIIFEKEDYAHKVAFECANKGLLVVLTGKKSVKLGPPLTTSLQIIEEGCQILQTAVKELFG